MVCLVLVESLLSFIVLQPWLLIQLKELFVCKHNTRRKVEILSMHGLTSFYKLNYIHEQNPRKRTWATPPGIPLMLSLGHSFPEGNHYCDSVCSMIHESCVQRGVILLFLYFLEMGSFVPIFFSLRYMCDSSILLPTVGDRSFIWTAISISHQILPKFVLDGPDHVQTFNRSKSVTLKKHRSS